MLDLSSLKCTPLINRHKSIGGKIIDFGGWALPVSYSGVLAEHEAVRRRCGLFDVSHMGEIRVRGQDALRFVQEMTMNDASVLKNGQGQYSAFLNQNGGFVDDIILYKISEQEFFICVNAANREKDFEWLRKHQAGYRITVANESAQWCQLAVQGPNSTEAVSALLSISEGFDLEKLPYSYIQEAQLFGFYSLIARTGYTGEVGYEIYLPDQIAEKTFDALLETNHATGIVPCGLGARDTLRLEACYLLYGNDMNDNVTPLEAGVAWAVKLHKPSFIGKEALVKQKAAGLSHKLVCIQMEENAIPRAAMNVCNLDQQPIGRITSGSVLPTVGGAGGMALIDQAFAKEGTDVLVEVRGQPKRAKVVRRPFYSPRTKRDGES